MTERSSAASGHARGDGATAGAQTLRELSEAGRLYERYLALTRLNEFPHVDIAEPEALDQAPTTDRPMGLVIDPSTAWSHPIGLEVSRTHR